MSAKVSATVAVASSNTAQHQAYARGRAGRELN